jgi:hypothetical protein
VLSMVTVEVRLTVLDVVGILEWVLTLVCVVMVLLVMVDASVPVTEWRDLVVFVRVRKLVSTSVDSSEEVMVLVLVVFSARPERGEMTWAEHLEMTKRTKKRKVWGSILRDTTRLWKCRGKGTHLVL